MDIWIWLLVGLLLLVPGKPETRTAGQDRVRVMALLLGLIYLVMAQA
jgi:hypothetical protein